MKRAVTSFNLHDCSQKKIFYFFLIEIYTVYNYRLHDIIEVDHYVFNVKFLKILMICYHSIELTSLAELLDGSSVLFLWILGGLNKH